LDARPQGSRGRCRFAVSDRAQVQRYPLLLLRTAQGRQRPCMDPDAPRLPRGPRLGLAPAAPGAADDAPAAVREAKEAVSVRKEGKAVSRYSGAKWHEQQRAEKASSWLIDHNVPRSTSKLSQLKQTHPSFDSLSPEYRAAIARLLEPPPRRGAYRRISCLACGERFRKDVMAHRWADYCSRPCYLRGVLVDGRVYR
jgi:hypothetical protein